MTLKKRKVIIRMIAFIGPAIVLTLALCLYFGIHSIWDIPAYYAMMKSDWHPIWKDLAFKRIAKGDDVEHIYKKYPPLYREVFPPYARLTYFKSGSTPGYYLLAKNSKLIDAYAGDTEVHHVFFSTPDEVDEANNRWSSYMQQKMLEADAYSIHKAQDVFISEDVNSASPIDWEAMAQGNYTEELIVKVSEVIRGNHKTGMILTFPGDNCSSHSEDSSVVFLRFDDSRTVYPRTEGGEIYTTVTKKALNWYLALAPNQVKEFETLMIERYAISPEERDKRFLEATANIGLQETP